MSARKIATRKSAPQSDGTGTHETPSTQESSEFVQTLLVTLANNCKNVARTLRGAPKSGVIDDLNRICLKLIEDTRSKHLPSENSSLARYDEIKDILDYLVDTFSYKETMTGEEGYTERCKLLEEINFELGVAYEKRRLLNDSIVFTIDDAIALITKNSGISLSVDQMAELFSTISV